MTDTATIALLADRLDIALTDIGSEMDDLRNDLGREIETPGEGPLADAFAIARELGQAAKGIPDDSRPDVSTDGTIHASVSIDVEVASVKALRDAALAQYAEANEHRSIKDVMSEFDDMYGTVEGPDMTGLLRLLFDSGRHMEGVTVQDSFATIHSAPAA